MNKLYVLSLLLILTAGNILSQSGWFWQNPISSSANFMEIQFINSNTGYICGRDNNIIGFCIKTTSGGKTWFVNGYSSTNQFSSLKFINNIGYIVSYPNLLKTIDAGNEWITIPLNITQAGLPTINFINDNTGFINGGPNLWGNLYKTTNGGVNFYSVNAGVEDYIYKTFFIDSNTIYLTGESGIFSRSYNIGSTWNSQYIPPYYQLRSLYFSNNNSGYICGNGYYGNPSPGRIYKTTNSGNNWVELTAPVRPNHFVEMEFTDLNSGYVIGDSGCVLKTVNAGANWNTMRFGTNEILNDISLYNFDSGFVAGKNGVLLKMRNQGTSFESINYSYRYKFKSVKFINNNMGFAVGDSGIIMKYYYGIWYPGFSNNLQNLNSVDFADSVTGISVGDKGVIMKTTNQGANWVSLISITDVNLNSVKFLNNIIYVVGDSGKIIKSTNSGNSWFNIQSSSTLNLKKVFIQSVNIVYVTGEMGLILKSTNGGINWISLEPNTPNNINCISSNGIDTLYIVGNNAMLKKSTDGGSTWLTITLPTFTFDLNEILFINNSLGYIVGNNGKILKTSNSGVTWGFQISSTTENINSMSFINSSTGYIVGNNGIIRKTTNSGGNTLTSLVNIPIQIPNSFALHQNYPNPFNPVTKIKFDIPTEGQRHAFDTKIIIYDLLGCEVATLVNEQLKPGSYSVDWDGTGFASGVYFYSLVTEDFVETKRMVLIK